MRGLATGLLILALCGAAWADAEGKLEPGGAVVVDGKTLAGCHYVLQGRAMYFPVLQIANAIGKKATVDPASRTVIWDGRAYDADVKLVDNVPYVGWRDLSRMAPAMQFGAASGKAYFTSRPAAPPKTQAGNADQARTLVSIVSQDLRIDSNRQNQVTVEAVFQNNTDKEIPNLIVNLVVVDPTGITAPTEPGSKGRVYASYQQSLGTLAAGEVRKLTFETDIREPKELDSGRSRIVVNLLGASIDSTPAELQYHFDIGQTKQ